MLSRSLFSVELRSHVFAVLLTTSAFASTVTVHEDSKVFSADYATKAEALNAGFDIAEGLEGASQSDLRNEFIIVNNSTAKNIVVDDTQIQVEEFARTRGEIQYRAVVDVDYHYNAHESD